MKFDEMKLGNIYKTKSYKVTREKVIEFAKEFDPQYLHLDEEKAKKVDLKILLLQEPIR